MARRLADRPGIVPLLRGGGALWRSFAGAGRAEWAPLCPEARRLARTAGTALAATSLLLGFAAGAQGQAHSPGTGGGTLPWVFALFAAAAVLGVFLFVLFLGGGPPTRPPGAPPPGAARSR